MDRREDEHENEEVDEREEDWQIILEMWAK